MKPRIFYLITAFLLTAYLPLAAQEGDWSVCDYFPPESRIRSLGIQGSFNWYDGPFADDRNRVLSATAVAEYSGLHSSASAGGTLDARASLQGSADGWEADFEGSGSLLSFFRNDLFVIGDAGLDAFSRGKIEIDVSAGVGTGRFRDVTPLARAIRIQNELLDLGELLAPVANSTLADLADIVAQIGPSLEEKAVRLVERLVATELITDDDIGVRGLLAVEEILDSGGETRLCGSDAQIRIGASAFLLPDPSLAATGILRARYAAVPDPVSQFDSNAEAKIRLAHPDESSVSAEISYSRRLPSGWTARAEYRLAIDRMWTAADRIVIAHSISGTLTTKILGAVGLSVVGNAQFQTGDEEMTLSLAVHLEADLF